MPQYNNYKNKNIPILYIFAVAPYTGAWIEIIQFNSPETTKMVALHASAWIEIALKDWQKE